MRFRALTLACALCFAVAQAAPRPAAPAPAPAPEPVPAAAPATVAAAEPPKVAAAPRAVAPEDTDAELDKKLGLEPKGAEGEPPASVGLQLLQTLVTLGLVLGLIYLVLNVGLRKLMGGAAAVAPAGALVAVVARVPLEPRRTLYVLKAAGEYLLVASSESGVAFLSKLDAAEVERLRAAPGPSSAVMSPFLEKLLSRRGGPPPEA